jgi:hypothetical protein
MFSACASGHPHGGPDGKAAEIWTQPADQYASDEFWS